MMPFSLFLALKYLKPKRSFVSVVTAISILGVLLGVAILVIVMSVMEGFGDMWRDKIMSFNAHLTVVRPSAVIHDCDAVAAKIESVQGVAHAVPYAETVVLVQNKGQVDAALLAGMNTDRAAMVNRVPQNIRYGVFDTSAGKIVVGWDLAMRLGISVGDRVLVYSPRTVTEKDEIYLPEELTVSGIFELGMWEFDRRFMLASLDTVRELCGIEEGALEIRVAVVDPDPEASLKTARRIRARLGPEFEAITWMQMKADLFAALRVEKNLMRFLLACIAVVAFFCVANTLIVVTVHKTGEIGLLKALGFSPLQIMRVFVWHGMIQCVVGTVLGIGTGLLVLHYRNDLLDLLATKFDYELFPKSIYQLSTLPATTTMDDVGTITILVFVFCLLASIIPAARAACLNPVEAMRNE